MQVYIILNLRNPSINSKNVREYFFLIFFFIVVLANFLNPLHKEQNKSKAYNFSSTDKSYGCQVWIFNNDSLMFSLDVIAKS